MGHYASEMSSYDGPTNEEEIAEKTAALQSDWNWGKDLLTGGHKPYRNGNKYTCPQCFARVNYWFLEKHDGWHKLLTSKILMGPGLIG